MKNLLCTWGKKYRFGKMGVGITICNEYIYITLVIYFTRQPREINFLLVDSYCSSLIPWSVHYILSFRGGILLLYCFSKGIAAAKKVIFLIAVPLWGGGKGHT